jgi:antirestriction protein ArdC
VTAALLWAFIHRYQEFVMNARASLHHTITQHIIAAMKHAKDASVPWLQNHGLPRNAASKQNYRGINILNLWVKANQKQYSSSTWATYKQWHALQPDMEVAA